MTESLDKVKQLYDERQTIPYDKNLIIEWMDNKVETLRKVKALYADSPEFLFMGEFDEKEGYPTKIDTTMWMSNAREDVHLHKGLQVLADALNVGIEKKPI